MRKEFVQAREAQRLTQMQLAAANNLSLATIGGLESGRLSKFHDQTLEKFSRAYHMPIEKVESILGIKRKIAAA